MVLTTTTKHLGPRHDRRLPVEHHRVLLRTDGDAIPRTGTRLHQRILDAEAVEPVGEVADGLVVVEVGLANPALRLLAPHAEEPVLLLHHGEAGVVDRLRADDDPGRLLLRPGGTRLPDHLGEREGQFPETRVRHRRRLEDAIPARLQVGADHLGEILAVRYVDLVEHDDARPVAEAAVLLQLFLDDVEVGDRVALGLQGRRVQDVDQHAAALDMAEEFEAEPLPWLAPGMRPGTSAIV